LEKLPDEQTIENVLNILQVLLREACKRHWWMMQIAPELPINKKVVKGLMEMGVRQRQEPAWASGRLALSVGEDSLVMGFNGKWRNCLRKGERLGVTVSRNNGTGADLDLLVRNYLDLQRSKSFQGLSEALIRRLAAQHGKAWEFNLFFARTTIESTSEEPIGILVTIRHGDTATYLIGSTSDKGRHMQANSVLLWRAILHAKESGCAWFDIGGLSDITPKGVAEFKKGIMATPYALVGEWRWYYRPW
jgi:lipid II:glycine glycyltransferase (peptidoglycan interpeptide bridge formation enzyme)